MTMLPVIAPPANGSLAAIELVTVVEKLASSPNAAASSFNVLSAEGEESTKLDTAVLTNAVVAILVVLLPALCVVVVGLPANATSSATLSPVTALSATFAVVTLASVILAVRTALSAMTLDVILVFAILSYFYCDQWSAIIHSCPNLTNTKLILFKSWRGFGNRFNTT